MGMSRPILVLEGISTSRSGVSDESHADRPVNIEIVTEIEADHTLMESALLSTHRRSYESEFDDYDELRSSFVLSQKDTGWDDFAFIAKEISIKNGHSLTQ
ncbi:hypothetical protein KEM54_000501 [Ascosphaera aggregata]|nr:hypothetical protein KEM54_000501 [Ascosphaera aggregata]